jgi:hypothetical protein
VKSAVKNQFPCGGAVVWTGIHSLPPGSVPQGGTVFDRCIPKLLADFLYRRLPSLLSRGFPNPQAVRHLCAPAHSYQQHRDARVFDRLHKK